MAETAHKPDISDIFYYSMDGMHATFCGIRVCLDREIDFDSMEAALKRTCPRFPYFLVRLKEEDGRLVTGPNPGSVRLHRDPPEKIICEKDNDGFLFRVAVSGSMLTFFSFHGISHFKNASAFLDVLLREYYTELGETVVPGKGAFDISEPPDPEETADPFDLLPASVRAPGSSSSSRAQESFAIPGVVSRDTYVSMFSVDGKSLMGYAKKYEGAPNSFAQIGLARAICRVYPEASEKGVTVSVTINADPILGIPKSHKPCLITSDFRFSPEIWNRDEDFIYTCVRGKTFADSSEFKVLPTLAGLRSFCEMLDSMPTVKTKQLLRNSGASFRRSTATVSYAGKADFGSVGKHITGLYALTSGVAPVVEITALGDRFFFSCSCRFQDNPVFRAFRDICAEKGMECSEIFEQVLRHAEGKPDLPEYGDNEVTRQMNAALEEYRSSRNAVSE